MHVCSMCYFEMSETVAACAGHGGISEPLTAEQQHQVSSRRTFLLSATPPCLQQSVTGLPCPMHRYLSTGRRSSLPPSPVVMLKACVMSSSFIKAVVTTACPAAQAFLSRLLLMLGSFVIMCLLLF